MGHSNFSQFICGPAEVFHGIIPVCLTQSGRVVSFYLHIFMAASLCYRNSNLSQLPCTYTAQRIKTGIRFFCPGREAMVIIVASLADSICRHPDVTLESGLVRIIIGKL